MLSDKAYVYTVRSFGLFVVLYSILVLLLLLAISWQIKIIIKRTIKTDKMWLTTTGQT